MRKALQLAILDARLFGTLHEPPAGSSQVSSRIGVLLLSFGQQPRSWVGDLGAMVADTVADAGFLCFRFDMPGLGDSPGYLPVHLEVLWRDIQLGAHEKYLHSLCKTLQSNYSLNGLIVGGFCGGAVTALYATNSLDFRLNGLLLLEPEIALTNADTNPPEQAATENMTVDDYLERKKIFINRITSIHAWGNLLTGKVDLKFWQGLFINIIHHITRRLSHTYDLPPETNKRFLASWHMARRRAIPTLVLSVGSVHRTKYYKSYGLEPGCSHPASKLQWIEIPNTTHAMLAGGAKESVCVHIIHCLEQYS